MWGPPAPVGATEAERRLRADLEPRYGFSSASPSSSEQPEPQKQRHSVQAQPQQAAAAARPKHAGVADSTDWIASSLTRRSGIGAGLAWAGFLAVGVVSEQLKTRFEVAQQQANTKSVPPPFTMLAAGR